ncbi:MAG: type I secretion C-terminal target domain-containing protein, partial [Limnohabitans sp.]
AYGATVRLYDSASGALVAMRAASSTAMASTANAGSYGADFFGLDPAKTYDVVVVYPGSDQRVTVLTGKAGLGISGINPSALNQIDDASLTAVAPGGKDVLWVAKENRSTSTTGGYWQGTGLADQMVGDKGNDVFKPNGARVGEAGDTLTGGGGKDRYVFDVKAVLNTVATITDFGANAGAEADSIDSGALLSSLGYTGARTAAGVADWVKLVDSGADTTLQIDAHTGSGGAASGFVDLVRLTGVSGKTLAQLVSGGFVHLGGLQLSNVPIDQVVTETASLAGIRLAAGASLAPEGGQWAAGFGGGQLLVSLDHATASDTLGLANTDGVSYDAGSRAVMIGGTQVATVDPTFNGVGTVGQLAMVFDFSSAGASYSTEAQQAAAVQSVLRALTLTSNTPAPLTLDRGITFRLTDALGDTLEVMSGIDITPEVNRVTLGGVNYITSTESVETLVGTTADETFVGYNGVPTLADQAYLGTAFTFGDNLTGGGGKDTFQWLKLQLMNADAGDRITDFGLKGGTGAGQGAAEADVIDLSMLLEGYSNSSTLADYVRASNVGGKVQIQVDHNGKANGSAFESTWFMTLDNLTVNASNQVVANNATVAATAPGLSGNVTLDTLVQQMVADSQFKLL